MIPICIIIEYRFVSSILVNNLKFTFGYVINTVYFIWGFYFRKIHTKHKCYLLKLRSSVWCVWFFWWAHISLYHKSIHFLHENAFFLLIVSQILKFVIVFNEDGYFCNWTALRNIILQFQLKTANKNFLSQIPAHCHFSFLNSDKPYKGKP